MAAFAAEPLAPAERIERESWLLVARSLRFELETQRAPQRDPLFYANAFDLAAYVTKSYAPLVQRARALAAHADAGVRVLALAEQQLDPVLPRALIEVALGNARGALDFLREDLPRALAPLEGDALRSEVLAAVQRLATASERHVAFLEARLSASDASFALGEAALLRMLRETQGIDLDLAQIEALCDTEIARDSAALAEAARSVDATRDVASVVTEVEAERLPPSELLEHTRAQLSALRTSIEANGVATIPSQDRVLVAESPAYMRDAFAWFVASGPLEPKPVESFFYITPPDPSWTAERQREFLPPRVTLFALSAHEGYPGHFLHELWIRRIPSRTQRALAEFASTITSEAWATYAEEIAWEASARDPRERIGQLEYALTRGGRCKAALGLHVRGWSVEQAARAIREISHTSEVVAHEEALRGTYDPMYLGYSAGKALIRSLREELRAKAAAEGREFSARAFHDAFMSHGGAPLPAIREAMLSAAND
jgi:uncharacterized protein (DUF885 family)